MEASWLPALWGHRGCAAAPKQPVPQDHPELPRLNHSWDCVWSFQLLCLLWTHREKVKPPMARAGPSLLQHPGRAASPPAEISSERGRDLPRGEKGSPAWGDSLGWCPVPPARGRTEAASEIPVGYQQGHQVISNRHHFTALNQAATCKYNLGKTDLLLILFISQGWESRDASPRCLLLAPGTCSLFPGCVWQGADRSQITDVYQ